MKNFCPRGIKRYYDPIIRDHFVALYKKGMSWKEIQKAIEETFEYYTEDGKSYSLPGFRRALETSTGLKVKDGKLIELRDPGAASEVSFATGFDGLREGLKGLQDNIQTLIDDIDELQGSIGLNKVLDALNNDDRKKAIRVIETLFLG